MKSLGSFSISTFIALASLHHFTDAFAPLKNLCLSSRFNGQETPFTILEAKNKGKLSMAQKRKKRGKKFVNKPMVRPDVLDEVPKADEWKKTVSTDEQVQSMKKDEDETKAQAAALIATQRKSVDTLTYVREQVEALSVEDILEALNGSKQYAVFDDLFKDDLCSEMMEESQSMFDNNKLELDLNSGITGGEYAAAVKGGEEQYVDCPRTVEYVVSFTRHLAGAVNKARSKDPSSTLDYKLDETASIAGIRLFDRKARLSALKLLTGEENHDNSDLVKKPFGCIVNKESDDDSDEVDMRKITAIYYMAPEVWDESCGGGVTFQDEKGEETFVEAKNDRLLLFSSEEAMHRIEPCTGKDGVENVFSQVVTHIVRERR
jgi:hypothetical protein